MINQYSLVLSPASQRQEILQSTSYLLHSIDVKRGLFDFLYTKRETLSATSFIDGRSPMSLDQTVWQVPIEEALEWHRLEPKTNHPNRFIFHTSFCGSTLLARTLDVDTKAFSYKEPNILLQLAEIKAKETELYRNREQWQQLIGFILNQLKSRWNDSEPTIIKPSNWVNSMLTELMLDNGESKAILLSTSPEEYLTAIFRGGSERVQYTYSLLQHLKTAFPEYSDIISEVESGRLETVDLFMRLSLISYVIQARAFCRVRTLVDNQHLATCNYSDLLSDSIQCVTNVANVLDLPLSPIEIGNSIEKNFEHHSKVTDRSFSIEDMQTVNSQVNTLYRSNFEAAMHWYKNKFDT